MVIDAILDDNSTFKDLVNYITNLTTNPQNKDILKDFLRARERNLKHFQDVKQRNELFFEEFWG